MRVGLNLVFLVPGMTGGLEVYARALLPALRRAAPAVEFTAFVGRDAAGEELGVDSVVLPVRAASRLDWVRGEQTVLPRIARRAGTTLVHSLAGTAPAHGGFAKVVTIHDLHHLTVPGAHFGVRGLGMRALVRLAARTADRIITPSQYSRRSVVEMLGVAPTDVDVVAHGLGRRTAPATPEGRLRERLGLGARPVALSLSAKRPHKNLTGLLDALAAIPSERRPVLVLPGYPTPHETELRLRARELGLESDVRFLGWVGDADAEGLLALAAVLVMPSFAEGFGLPVLEAMARGVPVACSGTTALGEVAGDAAVTFDPHVITQITAAVERLLADPADFPQRGRERAASFSWRSAAELTLVSYERALRSR